MSAFEVEQPILNAPFDEPAEHWQIEEGRCAEARRRVDAPPATSTAIRRRRRPSPAQPARGAWQELELVNLIRERLASLARGRLSGRDAERRSTCSGTGDARARAAALLRPARGG